MSCFHLCIKMTDTKKVILLCIGILISDQIRFPSDQIKMIISDQIWFLSDQIKILKSNQNQISLWSNQNSHIWSNLTSRHLSAHWSLHSHLHLHRREDSNHLNIASLNKTSKCSNMSRSPYRQMVQTWPASTTSPGSTFTTTTSAFIGAPTWHNSHYLSAEYIIGYSTAWATDFGNGQMMTTYMRVNAIKSLEPLGVSAGCVVVLHHDGPLLPVQLEVHLPHPVFVNLRWVLVLPRWRFNRVLVVQVVSSYCVRLPTIVILGMDCSRGSGWLQMRHCPLFSLDLAFCWHWRLKSLYFRDECWAEIISG